MKKQPGKPRKLDFRIEYQQQYESHVTYLWLLCSDGNGVMHGAKMTSFCEEFLEWCRDHGIVVEPKHCNPDPHPIAIECMQPLERVAQTESQEKIRYLFE